MTRRSRRAAAGGFAAIELAAGVALLLLPVTLLVVALPTWADRQTVARLAARDATRVLTLRTVCDTAAATDAVREAERAGGLATGSLDLAVDCAPGAALPRGGAVTVRVTVEIPALVVPALGAAGAWHWTATDVAPVDPYAAVP